MEKSFKLREEVINIENTTRFKSFKEIDNYMNILGAKEWEFHNTEERKWPFPIEKVYEYHGLLYAYNKENNTLILLGDLVDVILFDHYQTFIINQPLYYKYFYHNQVLNLEGLLYFIPYVRGADIGVGDEPMTITYRENVLYCKKKALELELNNYLPILENYNWNDKHESKDDNCELKNNLNKLSKLSYLLNIPNITELFNDILGKIVFHSKSDGDNISFNWKTTDLKLLCNFESNKDYQKMNIDLCYDDDRSETLNYNINEENEIINYVPLKELGEEEKFDITNGIITSKDKTRKATKYDYEKYNKIVESYINVILDKLPLLSDYLNNCNIKKK